MSLGLTNTIMERMHMFVHACRCLHFYVHVEARGKESQGSKTIQEHDE